MTEALHKARLVLDLRQLPVQIGMEPVTMLGHIIEVEVGYRFQAGLPASEEGPAEANTFAAQEVKLTRTLAMHDPADKTSLIIGAGADVRAYLSQRQMDWIEENLPVPGGV